MSDRTDRNRPLYMISVAAQLAGVHPQTLRASADGAGAGGRLSPAPACAVNSSFSLAAGRCQI